MPTYGKILGEDVKRHNVIKGLHRHDFGILLVEDWSRQFARAGCIARHQYQIGLKDLVADQQY